MLPQENFENLVVNVLNFSQIFTVVPLNMDYLITELGINQTFSFLKALGKTLGGAIANPGGTNALPPPGLTPGLFIVAVRDNKSAAEIGV